MRSLPYLDAAVIARTLPMDTAIHAIRAALVDGLNPAADPPRSALPVTAGQLLLMSSQTTHQVGVKVASVAPGNPDRGLPRIQGVYVLMDAETLTPVALLDGTALTALRTPAMSAVAVDVLARPDASTAVVFGSGPQAWGHVAAIRAVRPIEAVIVVGRDQDRAAAFAERVEATGVRARRGVATDVGSADLVVCATTSAQPVFDGSLTPDGACVVAVGSHEPQLRELDDDLLGRALVVVEDVATSLREAGDVIQAVASRALDPTRLQGIREVLLKPPALDDLRPRVFKGVGMSWQDLVVATAVYRADLQAGVRHNGRGGLPPTRR